MALGVDLGQAGVPGCEHVISGESQDEVLAKVREHLQSEHDVVASDELMDSVALLIGPIGK